MKSPPQRTPKSRKLSEGQKAVLEKMHARRRRTAFQDAKENRLPIPSVAAAESEEVHFQLEQTRTELEETTRRLAQAIYQNGLLSSQLQVALAENENLRGRFKSCKMTLHNERRKLTRAQHTAAQLRVTLRRSQEDCKLTVKRWRTDCTTAQHAEAEVRGAATVALQRVSNTNERLQARLTSSASQIDVLKKRCARFSKKLELAVKKARSRPVTFQLKSKGVYTPRTRRLARFLVQAGCAQTRVGELIQLFGRAMGMTVKELMSAHTVRRAVLEGGCASDIQLAHELRHTDGFTISGDATTHRRVNMEARHMITHVPSVDSEYDDGATARDAYVGRLIPKNRTLGVESSVDHTSETQVRGWQEKLAALVKAYNQSPLAERDGGQLALEECVIKLTGMSGDHAADQLKTHGLIRAWKREMTYLILGRNHLAGVDSGSDLDGSLSEASSSSEALAEVVARVQTAAVSAAGGSFSWAALSQDDRMAIYMSQIQEATMEVGKQIYDELSEEGRRPLDLFLRLGCMMHKDLNCVKGGNTAMMSAWGELDAVPPVLLANKENASTLRDVDVDILTAASSLLSLDDLTPAEVRALESSTRGATKLTGLAGALFNNKDDKKGYHDTYTYYFQEVVGRPLRFPDTSNTRYGSHCAAAAELLVHREDYLRFLEMVRDRKERPGFTNMEENVYRGLQDVPTITELAVLALYAQAVTHPYLRIARQNQNGLLLRSLHERLQTHLQRLIEDPMLLLSPGAGFLTGAMDALDWERPDVVSTIQGMAPDLPHLRPVLVKFLKGAMHTWTRFTEEFAKDGLIDLATAAELERAYILPTNDHNEGALGSYRVWARSNPNGTEVYFNAKVKYRTNETDAFMETHLSNDEDQRHLRAAARALDASGHESARRKAHVAHDVRIAHQRAEDRRERQRKADEAMAKVNATVLVLDLEIIRHFKNAELDEQLEVFRKRILDPVAPKKSKVSRRADKLVALKNAIIRYVLKPVVAGIQLQQAQGLPSAGREKMP
ncbi:hypothetical protein OH77DRAFT_1549428 [Trametes cingulata]|nr:hypothetical protein OH77DRAFT_1549428 [Trametes cingulata]